MKDRLDVNQQERVAERYHDHPLLCACQSAFRTYQARMRYLLFSPTEVFVEAVEVIDTLFEDGTDCLEYIRGLWEKLTIRYKLWPTVEKEESEYQTAVSSVFYAVAVTMSRHRHAYYNSTVKDAMLTEIDTHTSVVKQEEDSVIVSLSQYAEGLEQWLEAYAVSDAYLSDEIDDVAHGRKPEAVIAMMHDGKTGKRESRIADFKPVSATFTKAGTVLTANVTLVFQFLVEKKWIAESSDPDTFSVLFSGKASDKTIVWLKAKGALRDLFKMLVDENVITCPEGYSYLQIVSSHFKDKDGNYLTDLNSGYSGKKIQADLSHILVLIKAKYQPEDE